MTASNPNIIYGLQPVQRLDTAAYRDSLVRYYVPAGNTNALYVGDPVIKVTGSADVNGVNGVDLAAAGATNKITGVVCGFLGSCTAGNPGGVYDNSVSMYGNPPGNFHRPATTSLDYYVLVDDDPASEFLIQSDNNVGGGSSGTPVPVTAVGKNISLHAGTGSVLGWSGWFADSNTIITTNTGQLNIIGLYTDAQYAPPPALYQRLIVRLNTATELQQNSTGI